jgi:hypothetical protein
MRGTISETHKVDDEGNPAGGTSTGRGVVVSWQDGPLSVDGAAREPTGAFVEDVIAIAIGRLLFYQRATGGKFACTENEMAIAKLEEALHWLDRRTDDREARGVEGTHAP